jgi:hypothetical protein
VLPYISSAASTTGFTVTIAAAGTVDYVCL